MAFKIPVEDRVSTFPGRVIMTPVEGATNTYDMVRADSPLAEGTPINRALFDNKAYTLTSDVSVYVSPSGSDITGDGSSEAPFLTIQAAVDALPKHLGGHTVQFEITNGVYDEYINVVGFTAGQLVFGRYSSDITISGMSVSNSATLDLNIKKIIKTSATRGSLLRALSGSSILIRAGMTIEGVDGYYIGIDAYDNSVVSCSNDNRIVINNCYRAISASFGARVSVVEINGTGNIRALSAEMGGVISYDYGSISGSSGNNIKSGGRIWSGSGLSNMVPSGIE